MTTRRVLFTGILALSIALNLWFALSSGPKPLVNPRPGKDCSVEMKNILDGSWDPVIFVHGYTDNYSVASYIVDLAEKDESARGGRPKGSFRVKTY
jgi:hypothetical protein